MQAARDEIDAVVVCPGYMIGPYDVRPSSGKLVLDTALGKVPGYTGGCNSFADVRDVCRGMIAAWLKGRRGESYILGGHNLGYREIFSRIAMVAGVKPPRWRVPRAAAAVIGRLGDLQERLTGKEALLSTVRIRWAYCEGFRCSSEKASRELGYQISPLEPAIADALSWFKERGMLR